MNTNTNLINVYLKRVRKYHRFSILTEYFYIVKWYQGSADDAEDKYNLILKKYSKSKIFCENIPKNTAYKIK